MFERFIYKTKNLYAIATGNSVPLQTLNDGLFSKGTIGDGVVVEMRESTICSPCNGVLTMVFPTFHAFGVKADNGMELLIHIGIDTVNLKGKGFTSLVNKGSRVKRGQPIIQIDRSILLNAGYECKAILIITESNSLNYRFQYLQGVKAGKTVIVEVEGNI